MRIKGGQRPEVLENIKQNIAAAEQERRELRLTYNFNEFLKGNVQVLKNDEFYTELEVEVLAQPLANREKLTKLLIRLGEAAVTEPIAIRERALALLSSATQLYLEHNDAEIIFVLVDGICQWLRFETHFLPALSVLNKRLEDVLVWFLHNSFWAEAEEVFVLLYRIQCGSLPKSKAIQSLTSKTLHNLKKKDLVEMLTEGYLLENKQQYLFQNILNSIGHKAATHILNRVIHSHNRAERIVLLNLLPTFGATVIPLLEDCLKQSPPWAVVRNVIYIVSEIGKDTYYWLVEKYFGHSDERVQHEMIRCVLKLGGPKMTSRLLEGLGLVHDRLKVHILRLLVEQSDNDEKVKLTLLQLAQQRTRDFSSADQELLFAIIAAIKEFPCRESVVQLEKMHEEHSNKKGAEQLVLHISQALQVLVPKMRHNLQNVDNYRDDVFFDNDQIEQQRAEQKIRQTEEEIRALLAAQEVQKAGQLVYNQAVAAAQIKDFAVATLLLDRLLEVNPMALEEAVQLGEIIEEQKNNSITSHHLQIWSELYEEMTTEEFNALYYALRQENYHKGDIIVQKGETDNNLYFLNSGYISLSAVIGGKEIFLKRMQPSNILGGEQFFSPSIWTVSLKALSEIQVHVLDYSSFKKITEQFSEIEEKLQKYCNKPTQVPELLKMSGDDRREFPRYPVALPTRSLLLDPFGYKSKREFKGELLDVSKQGLAFTIKISNWNNARLLLGRHIVTTVVAEGEELAQQNGVIVGVRLHAPTSLDFSIHIKLTKKMDESTYQKILASVRLD